MEIKSKKTELKYDFQHDYYYGPNYTLQGEIYVPKIYPMFTPYGTLRWMSVRVHVMLFLLEFYNF